MALNSIVLLPCAKVGQVRGQSNLSKILRITAIALGVIAIIGGVLLLCGIFGTSQFTKILGGSLVGSGALVALAGLFVMCVKKKGQSDSKWTLSSDEIAALNSIKKKPGIRAGDYVGEEVVQAIRLMQQGKPEEFKVPERMGHGTHMLKTTNARHYLNDLVSHESALRSIIAYYRGDGNETEKAEILDRLLQKVLVWL